MVVSSESSVLQLRVGAGLSVPLRYLRVGGDLAVLARTDPLPQWARRLERIGGCVLRLPGEDGWRVASARAMAEGGDAARLRTAFLGEFGPEYVARHFGRSRLRAYRLELGRAPPTREAEPLRSGPAALAEEFDALAPFYEEMVYAQPFQRYLRDRAVELLEQRFPSPTRLIELGPGTGAQTLPMLRAGHEVLAVDPSARMLERLEERARSEGLGGRLTTRLGTAGALASAIDDPMAGPFGGAYSLFGALSLETDLEGLARALAEHLRPGALVVAGVIHRWPLLAAAQLLAAGRWRRAVAVLGPGRPEEGFLRTLSVRTVELGALGRSFGAAFAPVSVEAISLLAPPYPSPALERFWGANGLARLARLDRALVRRPFAPALAEQLAVTLRRRGGAAEGAPGDGL